MEINGTPSYADWIGHCFDHPGTDTDWQMGNEAAFWEADPARSLAFLTRLFTTSTETLARFSDAQLNHGFWYLASGSICDDMFVLVNETLPKADRIACIMALVDLFAGIFSERCTDAPSAHRSDGALSPLNSVCYMWFDIVPIHPMFGAARKNIDAAMLAALEKILALDSLACQESALHGLGHWTSGDPERIKRIVDTYLRRMPNTHVLRDYARRAAVGDVQ